MLHRRPLSLAMVLFYPALTLATSIGLSACGESVVDTPAGSTDGAPPVASVEPDSGTVPLGALDSGQNEYPPGATIESVGLHIVGGVISDEPFPEPTNNGREPVIKSAVLELQEDQTGELVVDVEVDGYSNGAGDSLHLLFDEVHVTIPVLLPESTPNIVPGWDADDISLWQCGYEDNSHGTTTEGCFPGCVDACTAAQECRNWFCNRDAGFESWEICTELVQSWELGPSPESASAPYFDVASTHAQCYARCSHVVAVLDEQVNGRPPPAGSGYDGWGELVEAVASLVGSPAGYADTLISRRLDGTYCDMIARHGGSTTNPHDHVIKNRLDCLPDVLQYWAPTGSSSEQERELYVMEQEKFFQCMATGEAPDEPAAPAPPRSRPRKIMRLRTTVFQTFVVPVLSTAMVHKSGAVTVSMIHPGFTIKLPAN